MPWARAGARARTASSSPWVRKATAATVDRRAFFSPSEPFHLVSDPDVRSPSPHTAGVKVGDTVLLPDYGGQSVDLGTYGASKDKEMFLYSDQEILGVIEPN